MDVSAIEVNYYYYYYKRSPSFQRLDSVTRDTSQSGRSRVL